jgi:hypothetical protein
MERNETKKEASQETVRGKAPFFRPPSGYLQRFDGGERGSPTWVRMLQEEMVVGRQDMMMMPS